MSFVLERFLPKRVAFRMATVYVFLTGLFMAITFTLTVNWTNRYYLKGVAKELVHDAGDIRAVLENPGISSDHLRSILTVLSSSWQHNIKALTVWNQDGSVLYESRDLILPAGHDDLDFIPMEKLGADDVRPTFFENHRHEGRLVAFSVAGSPGSDYRCVLAVYPVYAIKIISKIKYSLLYVLLAALVVFAVTGFVLAQRTYKPIQRMIVKAREATAGNLDLRLEGSGTGQELDELAFTFNDLFERLRESFERERDFNAHVAHEFRTPLTALRGRIESILLDETLSPDHREALAGAIEAADRLNDLIRSMLFLSRAESGLLPDIKKEKINLKTLVENACDLIFPGEIERADRLELEVPDSMECPADKDLMLRLILNLVDNVKRHTPSGTPITLRVMREHGMIRLEVQDRGKGIPEKDRDKIYDKFFTRVRQEAESKTGGSGLGLSIARIIARLHGGDLTYEQTPGGGATFICRIPLSPDENHTP